MQIAANVYISLSEIAKVMPEITYDWIDKNNDKFEKILHGLGLDTTQPMYEQQDIPHRNRFNEVVVCTRWVGYERTDREWLTSGYASQEAKDKAKGSKLLIDLYRLRGAVE